MPEKDKLTEVLETAHVAADLRRIPLSEWLADAVNDRAQFDQMNRDSASVQPGKWPGWIAITDKNGSLLIYRSVDRNEIHLRCWMPETGRPWMAWDRSDGILRNKVGACRTFATADAAKAALDKHHGNKR